MAFFVHSRNHSYQSADGVLTFNGQKLPKLKDSKDDALLKIEPMKGKGGALDWVGLLSDDALKAIKNWDDDLKAALHADLKASDDLVKELAKKPGLVEGWKVLYKEGVENAIRLNPKELEIVLNNLEVIKKVGYKKWLQISVDGVLISKNEIKALKQFKKNAYTLSDADFVRNFRELVAIGYTETALRDLLKMLRVNQDIEKVVKIVKRFGKTKADRFFATNFGDYAVLTRIVSLLDDFKQAPITGIKPRTYNQIVQDVNMKHILDKHTFEHFDFRVNANFSGKFTHGIDFFPVGTTERQIAGWIDECIPELKRLWLADGGIPMEKTYKIVIPSTGQKVAIGITNASTRAPWVDTRHFIIGQFYPLKAADGGNAVRVTENYLNSINQFF